MQGRDERRETGEVEVEVEGEGEGWSEEARNGEKKNAASTCYSAFSGWRREGEASIAMPHHTASRRAG